MKYKIICKTPRNVFPSFLNQSGFCSIKAAEKVLKSLCLLKNHDEWVDSNADISYFIRKEE